MIYRIVITNMQTGASFKATRRFPTREAADAWAVVNVPEFAGKCDWRVEAESDSCDAAVGLDG